MQADQLRLALAAAPPSARVWHYCVVFFFLLIGAMNFIAAIYFQRVGIIVKFNSGISLTWWFRWPFLFLKLARENDWPRWPAVVYCISVIGFVVAGYFLVHSAPHR